MSEKTAVLNRKNLAKQTFYRWQRELARFKDESITDPLTGLLNRRGFDKMLQDYYSIAQRTDNVLKIIFIDADKFKKINENSGYQIGDLALKIIAEGIKKTFQRITDIKARWGGDEFIVISLNKPDDKSSGVEKLSNKLNKAITELRLSKISNNVLITVTLGITIWNRQDSVEDLMKKVENQMHQRK